MILNNAKDNSLFKIIHLLMGAPFDFYLTGSRFFGGATINSDYDFFVKESPALRLFLAKNGFLPDTHARYVEDMSYTTIYMIEIETSIIQIQVVKEDEFWVKKEAQDLLEKMYGSINCVAGTPPGLPGDKTVHKHLWELAKFTVQVNKQA